MRLINKDDLLELIKDLEVTYQEDLDRLKDEELANPQRYRDTQRGRIEGVIDCYIDVYSAEEVKAIPIEWLEQMWERDKDGFVDEYGVYHSSDNSLGESCKHVLENWNTNYKWKWEKENELDKER